MHTLWLGEKLGIGVAPDASLHRHHEWQERILLVVISPGSRDVLSLRDIDRC